jgi:hypothetical protein
MKIIEAAMLSRDAAVTTVFREATAPLDIQLLDLNESSRFLDLVSQEPFDLVLVDCDGSAADRELISTLRQRSANREAVFMIAAPPEAAGELAAVGASVVLRKPVDLRTVRQYLQDAMRVIFQRQRFYARYPVDMDVVVKFPKRLQGKGKDLGEGGIALQLPERIELGPDELAHISFTFPGSDEKFEASAKLAWINNDMQAAFAFAGLSAAESARLAGWLHKQEAPPPQGPIVEAWLAKQGSGGETVVISPGLRERILATKPVVPKPQPVSLEQQPASASLRNKLILYGAIALALGILLGVIIAKRLLSP